MVQNDFLSVWVNYEVQRLSLEVDLGVMELQPNVFVEMSEELSLVRAQAFRFLHRDPAGG